MATLDFDALHPRWQPRFEDVPTFAITDLPLQIFTDIYKSISIFTDQYRCLQMNININIYRSISISIFTDLPLQSQNPSFQSPRPAWETILKR